MADGLNLARATRVTEILNDFRNIQNYMASLRANPSAEEYNEEGFVMLRRCVSDAQALLSQPFSAQSGSRGDAEEDKRHLRRIIVDASIRRFKAQKIYMRAIAVLRWVNARSAILQGQRPHAGHATALQQIRNALRAEISAVSDQRVEMSLRAADENQRKWLNEDPSLQCLQRVINNGSSR